MLSPPMPPGRLVHLPGRGSAWVWEAQGPPDAPALLLLHGWMATAALNWYTAFPRLGDRYRVVAMDMRGHGRGIRPRGPFRLDDCADDAAELCDRMSLGPVVAVGYSMGGAVAQLLWRRHRGQVGALVLCATAGLFASKPRLNAPMRVAARSMARALRALPHSASAVLARTALPERSRGALTMWATTERHPSDLGCLIEAGIELDTWDGAGELTGVDVPTAVVKTTADTVVEPWRQQLMADSIPGARVFPVSGGHSACVEQADEFVDTLMAACASVTT